MNEMDSTTASLVVTVRDSDALFQTGKLSPNTTRVRTELLCAFVCGPVYVALCAALCSCLCVRPCVRSFVCGPVYVIHSN